MELNILIQKFELSLKAKFACKCCIVLIVTIRVKILKNRLHPDEKTDWHEEKQMDTKAKKKS